MGLAEKVSDWRWRGENYVGTLGKLRILVFVEEHYPDYEGALPNHETLRINVVYGDSCLGVRESESSGSQLIYYDAGPNYPFYSRIQKTAEQNGKKAIENDRREGMNLARKLLAEEKK